MAQAKTARQYRQEWENHMGQLIYPALDSEIPIEEYDKIRHLISAVIDTAADKLFPDG